MKLKEVIDTIFEEEQGFLGSIDGYRLSVEGKEGTIPHIHCVKGNPKNPENVSCISLTKKGYANHSAWQTELPRKIFEKVCVFLSSDKWLKAVNDWNESNSFKIPDGFKNPYNNEMIYKKS